MGSDSINDKITDNINIFHSFNSFMRLFTRYFFRMYYFLISFLYRLPFLSRELVSVIGPTACCNNSSSFETLSISTSYFPTMLFWQFSFNFVFFFTWKSFLGVSANTDPILVTTHKLDIWEPFSIRNNNCSSVRGLFLLHFDA